MMIILIGRQSQLPPQRHDHEGHANSNPGERDREGNDRLTMDEGFEPSLSVDAVGDTDGTADGGEHAEFVAV
eukprot:CAMPEP_0184408786 /NCGR_PEP_ID=MMETSP0738-20130409/3552_1 /TAXON_ID=385413 /ORGANISM="Thalassiosira miniscula, Strain CCMP1093" /LENGTH=71 /DNA_ID=CAMNT_0026766351 /DNA_START=135 /DNA_END=350 /DNA_ORIENTATION=-